MAARFVQGRLSELRQIYHVDITRKVLWAVYYLKLYMSVTLISTIYNKFKQTLL